mmetsp:Transcript_52741/g.94166  ORF Transcript_52741/g.94166 Transcript_52741/m.94166 type:complete len:80 (+) Transcript_52741:962-1201(+)
MEAAFAQLSGLMTASVMLKVVVVCRNTAPAAAEAVEDGAEGDDASFVSMKSAELKAKITRPESSIKVQDQTDQQGGKEM